RAARVVAAHDARMAAARMAVHARRDRPFERGPVPLGGGRARRVVAGSRDRAARRDAADAWGRSVAHRAVRARDPVGLGGVRCTLQVDLYLACRTGFRGYFVA